MSKRHSRHACINNGCAAATAQPMAPDWDVDVAYIPYLEGDADLAFWSDSEDNKPLPLPGILSCHLSSGCVLALTKSSSRASTCRTAGSDASPARVAAAVQESSPSPLQGNEQPFDSTFQDEAVASDDFIHSTLNQTCSDGKCRIHMTSHGTAT